jgi:TPP-dependent pyruvate/acetoin dehydrogenase alpha subunit
MLLTRRFEEKSLELFRQGKIFDFCHTCIGQEAIAVGACFSLGKDDLVMPSLRGRGVYITKGISVKRILAGMYGKQTRPTMAKESIHHAGFPEFGVIAGTGVIGSDIARATGAALAAKLKEADQVVLDFFGDGASNRGDFHESINMAAIWKLPIVYICENNRYAMSTPISKSLAIDDISIRAKGYGIPGMSINGNDVLEVWETTQKAIGRARESKGPTLVECKTYRWLTHCAISAEDRSSREIQKQKQKLGCPIERLKAYLQEKGATNSIFEEIQEKVQAEIHQAIEYAEGLSFPTPDEALRNVYCDGESK